MNKKMLLLGSTSQSRQMLLKEALIPFQVIGHGADEDAVERSLPFKELLQAIARLKMEHVVLPNCYEEGEVVYVLTADSMGKDAQGIIHGKPKNEIDARAKIKALAQQSMTATAFCLDKKIMRNNKWTIEKRIERYVEATYEFIVPDAWVDRYLKHSWAMIASGAIAVELYGNQFLKSINGSYSTIVGLPMVEFREALEEIGFFEESE